MDRAAFLLLFSGVGLGWQPMPDGTDRYEYIVQVEPELLDTFAEGQSIPIVGDVPAHVHPIARVRVIVGRGEVPRQQLVTAMKPVADAEAPPAAEKEIPNSSIKLTQFYGTNPPAPSSGAAEWNAAADRYGAPAATAAAAAPTYQPTAPLATAPASPPVAGNEAYTWNIGETAASAASGPLAEVGQNLQNAAQPIRDRLDQAGNRLRGAFDKVGDGARDLVDDLGRPLRGSAAAPAVTAPPASNAAAIATAPGWNAPPATGAPAPATSSPIASAAGGTTWNEPDPASAAAAGVQPPRYSSAPAAAGDSYEWNSTDDAATSTATAQDDPLWSGDGPQLPSATGDLAGSTTLPWNNGSAASPTLGMPAIPEFGKDMLALPPTRPLEGTDPALSAASGLATGAPTAPDATRPASTARLLDSASHNWDTRPAATESNPPAPAPATERAGASPPPAPNRDNTAVVLAAWVLLTGSIAGNLYLFWSYLDVRQKYRALVRKTARAVGSRFSAA